MFAIETELVEKRREIDAREAKWLELVAEYDASEVWRASGHLSAAAALRRLCRMDAGQAASEVKLARKVGKLEAVRAALAAGDVSRRHVEAIAVAYTPERESALAALEDEFVDAARRFEPREVRNLVRYVSDALDGDGGAASDEEQFARRRWHMSRTIDGLLKIDARCPVSTPSTGKRRSAPRWSGSGWPATSALRRSGEPTRRRTSPVGRSTRDRWAAAATSVRT